MILGDTLFWNTNSRCIWALSDQYLVKQISLNDETNARNWLFNLHDTLSQEEYTVLVVTLWAIWRARRKAIYEDVF